MAQNHRKLNLVNSIDAQYRLDQALKKHKRFDYEVRKLSNSSITPTIEEQIRHYKALKLKEREKIEELNLVLKQAG
jgi:hypothetical protein